MRCLPKTDTFLTTPFLYPILDMEYVEKNGLDLYKLIDLWMYRSSIPFIQLRAKKYSLSGYTKLYKEILNYKPDVKVIVNDFWEFAIQENAYGLHIGKEDFSSLSVNSVLKLKEYSGVKGTSCHSIQDLLSLDPNIWNYTGFGPIFPTHSKKSDHPTLGTECLKHLPDMGNISIVLIGGISQQNAREIVSIGRFSIASISALSKEANLIQMEELNVAPHFIMEE